MSSFLKFYVISSFISIIFGGLVRISWLFHRPLVSTSYFLQRDRIFVLEKFDQCTPILPSYALTLNITKAFILKSALTIVGSIDVSQPLSGDLAIKWRFRKCPMNIKDCSSEIDFPIPNFCLIVGTKTPFGMALGQHFSPTLKCPMKKGHYYMNLTVNVYSIIHIPSDRVRYRCKMLFLDPRMKKYVGCIELVTYVRHLTWISIKPIIGLMTFVINCLTTVNFRLCFWQFDWLARASNTEKPMANTVFLFHGRVTPKNV